MRGFRYILCAMGFHKWEYEHIGGPRENRTCVRCGREEMNVYDMSYGDIYWTPGRWPKEEQP